MKIYVSRRSVAAGDDVNAPNPESFSVPEGTSLEEIITTISQSGYLPRISGGEASWTVTSNIPIAVVAQQWPKPHMFFLPSSDKLDVRDGILRLYFNYHAQIDPEIIRQIFWGFRLTAA